MKDLAFENPGFEGETWQSILHCVAVTSNSCTDDNIYASWPGNFFNGANAQFIYGANTGNSATVTGSTAASVPGNVGITVTFNSVPQPLAPGDYVVLRMTIPGNAQAGWWTQSANGGSFSTDTTDLSPETPGKQALYVNAAGNANQSADVTSFIDTTSNRSFIQLNGTYTITFRAKGMGGTNQIYLTLNRQTATANNLYLNQIVNLSNSWQDYSYSFNAAEVGATGVISLNFAAYDSAFYLDDVSFSKTSGSSSNTTAFRDEVVSTLQSLHPGILRYMDSGQNWGSSLDNMLAVPFARMRPGYSDFSTESTQIPIGLHDFLVLCQAVGAQPWYTMQTGMTTQEMQNLMDYLGGSTSTTYGAKRAALGQSAPWTSVFPVIHLEFGNEVWNTANPGANIANPIAYGTRAAAIFGAAKQMASYNANSFDFILDGWATSTYFNTNVLANSANYNTIDVAPYLFNTFNDASSNENIFGPMFAQPESFDSVTTGDMLQQAQVAQSATVPAKLAVYESNLSTTAGTVSQSSVASAVPSIGAGLAAVEHMLLMMRDDGILNQNMFSLTGYANSFYNPNISGETTPLWGAVVDMGNTNLRRPSFLALQMVNNAILPYLLQTTQSGANPTWSQVLSQNDNISLANAHYIQSFAFTNSSTNNIVVFNLNRTSSLPVSFAGANAPMGNVTVQTLTSANLTDDNEFSSVVAPTSSTQYLGSGQTLTLPPFSMTIITAAAPSGIGTPTPVPVVTRVTISCSPTTVNPSGNASCSSTVAGTGSYSTALNWSAVYGTVSSSGYYTAPSYVPNGGVDTITATSAANPTASSSATVTIVAPGTPTLSNIATNVTPNSVTVSWQSSAVTTNGVSYGTTSSLGQNTPWSSTTTANPSFTISGLNPGTEYYLQLFSSTSTATGFASLTITTPSGSSYISSVGVSCSPTSIAVGAGSACTANVSGGGSYSSGVTWSASAGTISSTGVFTAPTSVPSSGTVTVTATSQQNSSVYGTAVISITSGGTAGTAGSSGSSSSVTSVSPTCTPNSVSTNATTSCSATVSGTGSYSSGVTWTASVGSITSAGVYTAPATAPSSGTATITATSTQNTAISGSTTVSVTTPATGTPVISGITTSGLSGTSVTISWQTNQPTYNGISYGTTPSYGLTTNWVNASTETPTFTLTGLTAGTTYYFQVWSSGSTATAFSSFSLTTPSTSSTITSVSPSCSPTSVATNGTSTCSATVAGTGSYSSAVTWTASAGSISASGVFTATATAPSGGTVTITATSSQNSAKYGSTTISITGASPTVTSVSPSCSPTSVATSGTSTCSATVAGTGSYSSGVTWSASAGSISSSGVFTAPSTVPSGGTVTITATSTQNTAISGSTTVSITGGSSTVTSISVSCLPNSVTTNSTTSCTATVAGTGSYSSAVTWNTSAGTVSSSGVYTAPSTAPASGSATVIATSTQNTAISGAAVVTVTTAASGTPVLSGITTSNLTSSSVTISWQTNQPTYNGISYGTTPSYGLGTNWVNATTETPSFTLTGLNAGTTYYFQIWSSGATATGFSSFTLTTPSTSSSISSVSASCSPSSVGTGSTSSCAATVSGSGSYSSAVTWTASAGSISSSGVFTAPTTVPSGGTVTITATSSQNTAKYGSTTVTITGSSSSVTGLTPSCSPVAVSAGGTTSCSASVYGSGSYSSAVTWTASVGTINSSGTYTAPSSYSGSVTITATSVQNPSVSNTTLISVTATASGTPVLSSITTSNLTANSVTISWVSNQSTYNGISYGTTPSYGLNTNWVNTTTTTPSFTINGLSPNTTYYFQIWSSGATATAFSSFTLTTP